MYEIEYSAGFKRLHKDLAKISNVSNKDLMEFLGDKFMRSLYKNTNESLSTIDDLEISEYAKNHQIKIGKHYITLYNNTKADLSELSPEVAKNYPDGFSIAKAVEYGTGIVGAASEASSQAEDWEYDINNHGEQGWFYVKNGKLYWTKGFEGRLIYYKTAEDIMEVLPAWLKNYVDKTLN